MDKNRTLSLGNKLNRPKHYSEATVKFGTNTLGQQVLLDIAEQKHILIAGASGFGKSVATKHILEQLRGTKSLVIIGDPKRIEYKQFEDDFVIRTEQSEIEELILDVVREMDERYEAMRQAGVVDFQDIKVDRVILVIDEFGSWYMTIKDKLVKESLVRLLQQGRAAGIHCIFATQHATGKFVPTELKVNIACRIAFRLPTASASRVALDESGAEQLRAPGEYIMKTASGNTIKGKITKEDD